MTTMETQINEIMRSLGRIEQKTDSTITSLSKIETSLEKHETRIGKIEIERADEGGKLKVITAIWSAIIAIIISAIDYFLFKK